MSELALEAGLPNSTTHRMLSCLMREHFVCQVPGTRRYTLGALAFELGLAAAPYFDLGRAAAQILRKLASDTRDTVFLNLRSDSSSVCIARHEGHISIKAMTVDVGTRRPLSVSAGGVAILLSLSKSEQIRILRENLAAIVGQGLARQVAARRMFDRSKRLGYGCNLQDIMTGISAIGVPVSKDGGQPIGSLSLATSADRLGASRRHSLLKRLREDAQLIAPLSRDLRY